ALESILHNILVEDKFLRTYRRSISFGQNIKKNIIPLLIHAKDDKTVQLIIRILVNLTIPVECLLNVDLISKTDFGRHTIFEINNLLASTKAAFTDLQTSKALVDFLKKNVELEQKVKLSEEQRTNVSNCLLLLRNILHIPEDTGHNGSVHSIQNQILWNIFSQSVDKIIIKSMTICDARFWGVTMVQLVALLYKDQHVVTLHKLLNNWLEASLSESSEDNESNTSLQDRGSYDSSKMLTSSDPTSDSSDNSGCGKGGDNANSIKTDWRNDPVDSTTHNEDKQTFQQDNKDNDKSATPTTVEQDTGDDKSSGFGTTIEEQQTVISETSDCGYGTQIENQESISTSSNEDDLPTKKPVHQKPHNIKQRPNNKPRAGVTTQERKRKKIAKRGKANIINVQGLSHKTPTDDDISNVLKEFTVDFLLKGYNSLVQTLYNEILTNPLLEIDTSHFFWLVTYFLKFATQIELDLEHVDSVLSFEIVSYLTSEGVNLCEQFELAIKLDGKVMAQYGLLLDDYLINGEFVNDCIFTLMHHVGGEVGSLITLFQPKILKTFTAIWKSDFEICDDWSDLIEYVINTFVMKPSTLNNVHLFLEHGSFDDDQMFAGAADTIWTEDEISSLNWMYMQSSAQSDVIGAITKQLKEEGIDKTRNSVIRELFRQNLISRDFYAQLKGESDRNTRTVQLAKETRDDEIRKYCEHLIQDGKSTCLDWVQKVLLEICHAKLQIHKMKLKKPAPVGSESKLLNFEIFRKEYEDLPVVSPVAYHSLNLKFLQLLHKLGFHMPVDTGRLFIRIPQFWTAEYLFIKLKFSVSELADSETCKTQLDSTILEDVPLTGAPDNFYQIHEQRLATMVNYTPRPGHPFGSDAEVEHLNWLQIVKKSQECKINLERRETTLVLESQATAATASAMLAGTSAMLSGPSAMLSGPSAMSIKQDTLLYNAHLDDPEYYNSACETASVASDLTHMYVSDEDEKPEVVVRPAIVMSTIKEQTRNKARTSGKRRRGQF
ncbi:Timeless, partial [Operophtera brumata]